MFSDTIRREPFHTGEYLLEELPGTLSRETITLAQGAGVLYPGTVLGRVRGAVTSAPLAGNVGNGALGAVTAGAGAMEGVYRLTLIEPGTNAGVFVLEAPNGVTVGRGAVGAAFNAGGLAFTLADGTTDFVSGDTFLITVAPGTTYAMYGDDHTDGTEWAQGVLYEGRDATSAPKTAVMHAAWCAVNSHCLTGLTATAQAQLKKRGVQVR
jgi:hypothetical protein